MGVVDGLEESFSGLVELACGLMIAQGVGEFVEVLEGAARGEVAPSREPSRRKDTPGRVLRGLTHDS